jgi:hypothetical protein
VKIVHAEFEKSNLNVDAYEVRPEAEDTVAEYEREEQRLVRLGAQYLVVKTPVNNADWLFGLPKLGYTFVETVFHVSLKASDYHMPADVARFDRGLTVTECSQTAQREQVYAQVRCGDVFKSDRVSIDPAFTLAQSGNRYANWLRQLAENGGKLYEVRTGGRAFGFFVITRVDDSTVDPVLMGLYNEERDRGMGALLHKKTLDTCFTWPCERLASTIVSNNYKVLRVYVNAGATITDTEYTYVKHL